MKTIISDRNPYGYDRYGFLWQTLYDQAEMTNHLDFGGSSGSVARTLIETEVVSHCTVVDAKEEVIKEQEAVSSGGVTYVHVPPAHALPFDDHTFDSASALDVIEHIADQRAILCELQRVIRPGGILIVTVPGQHAFSFLDTGNLKFRFPRLHRVAYSKLYSSESYNARYVRQPDGLFGDIEAAKMWHEHFSQASLADLLLSSGFSIEGFDGAGLFARVLVLAQWPLKAARLSPIEKLMRLDARAFRRTHLFCIARRT